MEIVIASVVLAGIVAMIVLNPLRASGQRARIEEDRRAALEAAKEAKYREIRDAELDYRMGKVSEADWHDADAELRADAMQILRDLDELGDPSPNGDGES